MLNTEPAASVFSTSRVNLFLPFILATAVVWFCCPAAFAQQGTQTDRAGETVRVASQPLLAPGLPGWKSFSETPGTATEDVWRLDGDGVLRCKGTPKGYLYTDKNYTDFVLRLQWRWPEGKPGKGGVLIRMAPPHKIWPSSLEAQINAGEAGDFWGLDGYSLSGPAERLKRLEHPQFGKLTNLRRTADVEKPAGEWNTYQIRASGGTVTLTINGQQVNRAEQCQIRPGAICLTAEGSEIQFRNVELEAK